MQIKCLKELCLLTVELNSTEPIVFFSRLEYQVNNEETGEFELKIVDSKVFTNTHMNPIEMRRSALYFSSDGASANIFFVGVTFDIEIWMSDQIGADLWPGATGAFIASDRDSDCSDLSIGLVSSSQLLLTNIDVQIETVIYEVGDLVEEGEVSTGIYFETFTVGDYDGESINPETAVCFTFDEICDDFVLYKSVKTDPSPFWHENWFANA